MARVPFIVEDERGRKRALDVLATLDLTKPWQVVIEPYRKKRTTSQNALMWAWLEQVAQLVHDDTGTDKDDIHEFFKLKFLPVRTITINGEERHIPGSTTKLTTAEMMEYMDKINAWVTSTLGLILPTPEDLAA
jgi:hypothetical protein